MKCFFIPNRLYREGIPGIDKTCPIYYAEHSDPPPKE